MRTGASKARITNQRNGLLVETRPIFATRGAGTVKVFVTPRLWKKAAQNPGAVIFNIFLFDTLLILCLYFLLWRLVLNPLKQLEQYALRSARAAAKTRFPKSTISRELEICAVAGKNDRPAESALSGIAGSEERYRTVVEFSPECVVVTVDDCFVYVKSSGRKNAAGGKYGQVSGSLHI